jgi:hypothetical protein
MRTKAGRAARNFASGYIYQGYLNEQPKNREVHKGDAGYTECHVCKRWVRVRVDGNLYSHFTLNKGRVNCLGSLQPAQVANDA